MEVENFSSYKNCKLVHIKGKLDVASLNELERCLNNLIEEGTKYIVLDCSELTYISSAGLRILLKSQKSIKVANGEIVLYKIPEIIIETFKLSGFVKLFTFIYDLEKLEKYISELSNETKIQIIENEDLSIKYLKKEGEIGKAELLGEIGKLKFSEYNETDIMTISPMKYKYGIGLGTAGKNYTEFKEYFGESIIINNSIFFYPAKEKSMVDYFLFNQLNPDIYYHYFNGIAFNGSFKFIINFTAIDNLMTIQELHRIIYSNFPKKLYGVVLLGESKGFFGMNLKKLPINIGIDIFSLENFSKYFNFPVEPSDFNHPILSLGVIYPEEYSLNTKLKENIFQENNYHIHSLIYEKSIINYDIDSFENEINRIINELQPLKLQHLLPKSLFNRGIMGLIELEE